VGATINGRGPYDCILDTGAGISLLSPEVARELGIEVIGKKEARGAAGPVSLSLGRVESLAVGDAVVRAPEVAITGELLRIGAAVGARIDGNLGYSFLSHFRVTVDYARSTLRLTGANHEDTGRAARGQVAFRLAAADKPLVIVPVLVNGSHAYEFALDTGASVTVVTPELARQQGLTLREMPSMAGGGGTMSASAGQLESLALGGAESRRVSVVASGFLGPLSDAVGAKLDGILGYNFLREFRVTIDYPHRAVGLD
jgi:predicted aspartyl protease